jgi:predicted Zn-dependent peptidase
MNAERLKSYMHSHYHLQNTVISIAGNVDESVIELMETYFGSFNRQGMQDEIVQPVFQGDVIFRKKSTEQNHICLSFPGCSVSEPRLYAMILFNNLLGGGMSSRLFQEIREKRGLAYSVYSYHSSHIDSGLLTIYAGTAPKQTKTVLDLTLEILQETIAKGLTEAEVEKGKEQLKGSLILSLESTSSRMNRLGKNELMLGKHYTLDELIDRIDAVTMNDIQSLFEQTFSVPYALAMVGDNDRVIEGIRREPLVQHSS